MNIANEENIVNNFTITKKYISKLCQALAYTFDLKHEFRETRDMIGIGDGSKLYSLLPPEDDNCILQVPRDFVNPDSSKGIGKNRRRTARERFPNSFSKLDIPYLDITTMLKDFAMHLRRQPMILTVKDDDSGCFFPAPIKGSAMYNEKYRRRITEASRILGETYDAVFFLTITYSVNQHGHDYINAWKSFQEHGLKIKRELRRKLKVEYVEVVESTRNGYPHSHILLGVNNKAWLPKKSDLRGTKVVKGRLVRLLVKYLPSPVFELKLAEDKKVANYLMKYITKTMTADSLETASSTGELSSKDTKGFLSCFMPILSETRQFRISQGLQTKLKDAKTWDGLISEEALDDYLAMPDFNPHLKQLLEKSLTKLTSRCRCHTAITRNPFILDYFQAEIGYHAKIDPNDIEFFVNNSVCLGCKGCIFTNALQEKYPKLRKCLGT